MMLLNATKLLESQPSMSHDKLNTHEKVTFLDFVNFQKLISWVLDISDKNGFHYRYQQMENYKKSDVLEKY